MTLSRQSHHHHQSNRNMSHPHDTNNTRGTIHNRFQSAEITHQRCKRRTNLGHLSYMVPTPHSNPQGASGNGMPTAVAKRNERERKRVRMVNNGFTTLRQHVPSGAKNKKLSKVETLRSAIDYIKHLQQVLGIYDMPLPTQHSDLDNISLEDEQVSMESSRSESMTVTNLDDADENVFPSTASRYQSEYGTSSYSNDSVTNAVTPYHVIPHYGGLNTCQYQGNYSHIAVGNCSVSPSMGLESNCHNMPNYNTGDELLNGVTTWFN